MAKKNSKLVPLSPLAAELLVEMAKTPNRIEYHVRVLGGAFLDQDVARLDAAYAELAKRRLIEPANAGISFFGAYKPLYRVTHEAAPVVRGLAA